MNKFRCLQTVLVMMLVPTLTFSQARSVQRLTIEVTGKSNGTDANRIALCREFNPSQRQARHYFNRAYYVPSSAVAAAYNTQCYATGDLVFSDGSAATWTLYANGNASLKFTRGDEASLHYGGNAWRDPLAGTEHPHETAISQQPRSSAKPAFNK